MINKHIRQGDLMFIQIKELPKDNNDADSSLAWTFGMTKEEYSPDQEA